MCPTMVIILALDFEQNLRFVYSDLYVFLVLFIFLMFIANQ